MTLADYSARTRALAADISFIIQAPAGSGKTALLTQRYLRLLSLVQAPEEIVALTFTRKAAAEMRERIYQALQQANASLADSSEYAQQLHELGQAALARSNKLKWHILDNPNRLRIQTIDSLCASLIRQMPILSHFGAPMQVSENPTSLYRTAVARLLLEHNNTALQKLLLHLDNQHGRLENLLIDMLGHREQWLPYMVFAQNNQQLRAGLEQSLEHVIVDAIANIEDSMHTESINILQRLIIFSLEQRELIINQNNPQQFWQIAVELLLTQSGQWRKSITKKQGFPAPSSARNKEEKAYWQSMKSSLTELITELNEDETLRAALVNFQHRPPLNYSTQQWEILAALSEVLPRLVAHLKVIFSQQQQVDFSEITSATLTALGDADSPTDLALHLDYRIQHLLVDEFQDTSIQQFTLIEKLTAGWQPGDGRTLFLVGDPMQSIYRFRQAEVGLFLRAQQYGIGDITLESLQLSTNFRSTPEIVDWNNQIFLNLFPAHEDMASGAIAYSSSTVIANPCENSQVYCHPCSDRIAEAEYIAKIIQDNPHDNIAILVKARTHLVEIIPVLQQNHIDFQAIELERLSHNSLIYDLKSLTLALLNPADRTAWLSVLRAPWCGLNLADIHALVEQDFSTTILQKIISPEQHPTLSKNGQLRLRKVSLVFANAFIGRRRQTLARYVKSIWQQLDGPACIEGYEHDNAELFFALLEKHDRGGDLFNIPNFLHELNLLFASNKTEQAKVQLMTIHKAKGLEFDRVILPGLDRTTQGGQSTLLLWLERTRANGANDLLLAPIKATEESKDPIFAYLQYADKQKSLYETQRLLYVACTRAIHSLHLLASPPESNEQKPRPNSFLHMLWPQLDTMFSTDTLSANAATSTGSDTRFIVQPKRLPDRFFSSDQPPEFSEQIQNADFQYTPWQFDRARHFGLLVHQELFLLGTQQITQLTPSYKNSRQQYMHHYLKLQGENSAQIHLICQQVLECMENILNDPRGLWILDNKHQASHFEHALILANANSHKKIVIDRHFIDENNQRWIIDYKTVAEQPHDLIAEQHKHAAQLQRYAAALNGQTCQNTQLALYYPQYTLWHTWAYDTDFA